jgi:predicted phage terminase large subunit-like protein
MPDRISGLLEPRINSIGATITEDIISALERCAEPWRDTPASMALKLGRGKWIAYGYLLLMCQKIVDCINKPNGRLIINIPPRFGKSELISHWTPTWYLSRYPTNKVMLASYGQTLAARFGRMTRNTIVGNQKQLGLRLSPDSKAGAMWELATGGGMLSAGIGGGITGWGFDVGLIDDIVKDWKQAQSLSYHEDVIEWFNSTFYTRAEPGASIIVLMTRWHRMDLTGYLRRPEEEGGHMDTWDELVIPALCEDPETDPVGRELDEPLNPDRKTFAFLNALRNAKGNHERMVWAGVYQQRPEITEGNIFKYEWWKYYDELPPKEQWRRIVTSWDTALEENEDADFTVGTTWLEAEWDFSEWDPENDEGPFLCYYLLDMYREKIEYPELKAAVISQWEKHGDDCILIERKASGTQLIQELSRPDKFHQKGLPIKSIVPGGSKVYRANLSTGIIEEGRVFMPYPSNGNTYVHKILDELGVFPKGAHDDIVDSITQALLDMSGKTGPQIL